MATASFVTDITEIITQAVEAAAMIGSLWSSMKVVDQARDYYNLYNAQRQFYYSVFQTGAEAPLAATVYNINAFAVDYAGSVSELIQVTGVFGGPMGDTQGWWSRHSAMFGATISSAIQGEEYAQDRILLLSHWSNIMFRFEESNVDMLNDRRWDHRMKLHNVALKQQSAVVSGLDNAEGQRENVLTKTGSYYAGISNSLAERRGLVQAHKDVQARYAELANGTATTYDVGSPAPAAAARSGASSPSPYHATTYALGTMPSDNDHFRSVN